MQNERPWLDEIDISVSSVGGGSEGEGRPSPKSAPVPNRPSKTTPAKSPPEERKPDQAPAK